MRETKVSIRLLQGIAPFLQLRLESDQMATFFRDHYEICPAAVIVELT